MDGGLLRNHAGMNRAETLLARRNVKRVAVRMMRAGFEGWVDTCWVCLWTRII